MPIILFVDSYREQKGDGEMNVNSETDASLSRLRERLAFLKAGYSPVADRRAAVAYQTTTMDTGILEALYEGDDFDGARGAALAHEGKCSIVHFRYDGTVRPVMDFRNGQATRGYVYN